MVLSVAVDNVGDMGKMSVMYDTTGTASVEAAPLPRRAMAPSEASLPDPINVATPSGLDDRDGDEWLDWFLGQSAEFRISNRVALMVSGLRAGLTLQAVGDLYGVSRERVRQIAVKQGLVTSELRRQASQQRDRYERRVARHIFGVSLSHPELTLEELAEWAETDVDSVRTSLGHRVGVHEVSQNSWSAGLPDDELLEALREWAASATSHGGDEYTSWAQERGLPGKQTVQNRFGGWNNGLIAAGLSQHVRDRGGLRPVISDEEMWASVLQFLRDDLTSYSFQSYEAYAAERQMASGASVRVRLGSWATIKEQVRALMRYAVDRDGSWEWAESILEIVAGDAPRNTVSRDQAVEAIRKVAERIDGPVTVMAYEDARDADDPHASIAQKRLGSWINAVAEAGLTDRLSGKARGKWQRGEYDVA